jgi:hypothetical protein
MAGLAEDRGTGLKVTERHHFFVRFCSTECLGVSSNWLNMKNHNSMNIRAGTASLALAGVAALVSGCAEPQTTYVPVYHTGPAYVVQQPYPPPVTYQVQPAPSAAPAAPTAEWQAPAAAPVPVPAQPPPQVVVAPPQQTVVVQSAPPPPRVEVIPAAPGPYYVWTSGYWAWNGGWVWVRGRYVARPRPTAVWVGGHWSRHGHGYVWVAGGWR